MHYVIRLIAGFAAAVLVVIFPLQYIAQLQNETISDLVDNHTRDFSDTIRDKGYLDIETYEKFVEFLDSTGDLYDMDIEDIHPVTGSEDDLALNNNGKDAAIENISLYSKNSKPVASVTDMSLKSNSSYKGKIISLAAHTHTDACYAGHRHNSSCIPSGDMSKKVIVEYSRNYTSSDHQNKYFCNIKCATCGKYLWYTRYSANTSGTGGSPGSIQLQCYTYDETGKVNVKINGYSPIDDNLYGRGIAISDMGQKLQAYCKTLPLASCTDQGNGNYYAVTTPVTWNYGDFEYLVAGEYETYYMPYLGCPYCGKYGENYSCKIVQDENPVCDKVVTSITAAQPNQTIIQGNAIDTTAKAAMLDGSIKTVSCSVSGYNSELLDTPQNVTLTYSGLVGNAKTTGTMSCTVQVIVKSSKKLTSLSVAPAQQTILRGETPSFTVTANYSDGSNKILSGSQYSMSSLDTSVSGPHTVNFSFTEGTITQEASATVYVDELIALSVTPSYQSVERYTSKAVLPVTVTGTYLYSGSKTISSGYSIDGYFPSMISEQNVVITYTDHGVTKTAKTLIQVTPLHRVCPHCHNSYDLNLDDSDPGCPFCKDLVTGIKVTPDYLEVTQGDELPITVNAEYNDGSSGEVTGWTSNYTPDRTGLQLVTIEYGGYAADITVWVNEDMLTCPVCGTKYPASEGKCPVCADTVISISASPNPLTVNQYEDINLTVIANYADGSSRPVTDWSIDKTTTEAGTFTATITYQDITATITMTVISSTSVTCPVCGISYEPLDNPRGCPICSNELTGIEAYLTSGSGLVQYGSLPGVAVVLIYRDTHREITTKDYTIDNYDAYKLGTQTITVRYNGFRANIDIEVVDTLSTIICPNGHVYYRNDDGSDPGCPHCAMGEGADTVYYFDITYIEDILKAVYADGIYHFKPGNFITINITKKDLSLYIKLQNLFFKTSLIGRKKEYTYGGEVF